MKVVTDNKHYNDIADAIREKTETEKIYYPEEMASGVNEAFEAGQASIIEKNVKHLRNNFVVSVSDYAFYYDTSLESVDLPMATSIGGRAFYGNTSLKNIDLPMVTSIDTYAFYGDTSLESVDLPMATSIGGSAFYNNTSIESVDLPMATSIGGSAFYGNTSLKNIDLPMVTSIDNAVIRACTSLKNIDLPMVTSIDTYAFYGDTNLTSIILRSSNVCTLRATNSFNNTPIKSGKGFIYVPSSLVETYKTATNWSSYATQIRAIEDYPDITGG